MVLKSQVMTSVFHINLKDLQNSRYLKLFVKSQNINLHRKIFPQTITVSESTSGSSQTSWDCYQTHKWVSFTVPS